MKLHLNKTIFVDIDGTLYRDGELDRKLVRWMKFKKGRGFVFVLWSARGKPYAEQFASAFALTDLFDAILSKPGAIIDDRGWSWTGYIRQIDRDQVLLELGETIDDAEPAARKEFSESGVDETRDAAGKSQG